MPTLLFSEIHDLFKTRFKCARGVLGNHYFLFRIADHLTGFFKILVHSIFCRMLLCPSPSSLHRSSSFGWRFSSTSSLMHLLQLFLFFSSARHHPFLENSNVFIKTWVVLSLISHDSLLSTFGMWLLLSRLLFDCKTLIFSLMPCTQQSLTHWTLVRTFLWVIWLFLSHFAILFLLSNGSFTNPWVEHFRIITSIAT